MVAPASALPLLVLMSGFVPLYFWRRPQLPPQVIPLFFFILIAIASTALSFFVEFPLFREVSRSRNSLAGIITLGIGISFFLAALLLTDSENRLAFYLKWVNIGGIIALTWAGLQSVYWYITEGYPEWMYAIQGWISSSGNLYVRRTTGLAFEPSWLGHQLVMFYLPYWLAASFRGFSAFGKRLWKFSAENILLAGGILILLLSLARSALLSFSLSAGWLIILLTARFASHLHVRFSSRKPVNSAPRASRLLKISIWLIILTAYAGALLAGVFLITRLDPRMEDLFRILSNPYNPLEAANYLYFGERVAFWVTGLQIFNHFPLVGVGLENAGYFFPEMLPPFGWTVVESHKMYYSNALPNTLSLWVRLLSETGILGFSAFLSFLYLLWRTARLLHRHPQPLISTLALTAQFTLLALLSEGMSVDTFAFPYYWLIFGWLLAAFILKFKSADNGIPLQGWAAMGANGQVREVSPER